MSEITLESLAARIDALEAKLAGRTNVIPASRPWWSVVGISTESEFSRAMAAEMAALKEADRQAAQQGSEP